MTDENRRSNIAFELDHARLAREEVEALMERKLWAGAVSRAYYGAFYLARALLFSKGQEARTHGGLVHLMSVHLVHTGEFPAELVHGFSQMQRMREDADYASAMVFNEAAAVEARERLAAFQDAALACLRQQGFSS